MAALVERESLSKLLLSRILQKQVQVKYPDRTEYDYSASNITKAVNAAVAAADALILLGPGERIGVAAELLADILENNATVKFPNRIEYDYSTPGVISKSVIDAVTAADKLLEVVPGGGDPGVGPEIPVGGVTQFLHLTDVPNTYVGQALLGLRVKLDETGLEFSSTGSPADKITLISITGLTVAGTIIDLTASGATWTKTGVSAALGPTDTIFNTTPRYRVERNGVNQIKGDEVVYETSSSISFSRDLDVGEEIQVFS